jgi:ribose transport system permease protein
MGIGKKINTVFSAVFGLKESGIIITTVLFGVIISTVNPVFISSVNIVNVLRSTGYTLIIALGMTLVLILQGLDLSVGSVLGLGGCIAGLAMKSLNLPIVPAILLGCASGFLIGLINGLVIIKFKIPPLIVTLGMMYMARGIVYIVTKGVPIYPLSQEFQSIEQVPVFGIPKIVILAAVLSVIAHVFLTRTTIGRSIYATGGNKEAANLSGINMNKINLVCYCIIGTLAAATGVIMASRLGSAQPSAGTSYEMTTIAASIIGGTSTSGGSGTILGTITGALFMNILSNAMTVMKISVYWQNFVIGFILVLAVIMDQVKKDRMMLMGTKAKD